MDLGDRVCIERNGSSYEGVLMPSRRKDHVVIKLDNGYNIGLYLPKSKLTLVEKGQELKPLDWDKPLRRKAGLPQVSILSTGGTIASKVDYRTGAVTSQFSAGEIIAAIPELEEIANYNARVIYQILSENMRADYWMALARAVAEEIRSGAEGIIITHGTDTMMYTAAAISFMLKTPVPVVIVGSQRSSDRPSSDAAMNAICAATVAISDIAGGLCGDARHDQRRLLFYSSRHKGAQDAYISKRRLPEHEPATSGARGLPIPQDPDVPALSSSQRV